METVVLILMMLVCFTFLLKQTFHSPIVWVGISILLLLYTGMSWPLAIEQSKTQISDWLTNPSLMQDTAVIITLDVMIQIIFCIMDLRVGDGGGRKRGSRIGYLIAKWVPGFMIFPVLFSALTSVIFSFPGISFQAISWSMAVGISLLNPLLVLLVRHLLPEREIRLEVLFLCNLLLAILAIVATVNGKTAVEATNNADWNALAETGLVIISGSIIGFVLYELKTRFRHKRLHK